MAVLGGTFDPVHCGHLMLASYIAQFSDVDEVWLSLSPQNPFKCDRILTDDSIRRDMLEIAVGNSCNVRMCDIELSMPRPSYMIDALRCLRKRYDSCSFRLVIGSDNYDGFDRWKESDAIRREFGLIVYPRPGYPLPPRPRDNETFVDAPVMDISSTFIRDAVKMGKDMNFFLPPGVYDYIKEHNLYC